MPIDPKRILFQDIHFLAVHKLSGELVVRGKGKLEKLPLLDFLKKDFPGLRPVNRLDFETSGVVLFARTKAALAAMIPSLSKKTAEDREILKTYVALITGTPPVKEGGVIRAPLPARNSEKLVPAETKYRVLEQFEYVALVEASFVSGRHHQIRRHFAAIKHPLILDSLYGIENANKAFSKHFHYQRFFLHAAKLTFLHPFTDQKVTIEAPLPPAFEEVLKKLRG